MRLVVFLFAVGVSVLASAAAPVVFVSIPPQAWLVRSIAGEALDVRTLLPAGANPHTFEPTVRQMKALAASSLYFTEGVAFEASLVPHLKSLNPSLRVEPMDRGIAKRADPDGDGGGDPHVWLAPSLYAAMASNAVAVLDASFPERRGDFAAGLAKTLAAVFSADAEIRKARSAGPAFTWVVYHPALDYFTAAYGGRTLVIEEDGKAPSPRHLAAVIREAGACRASCVLVSPGNDPRCPKLVAGQLGLPLVIFNPLQEDWPALMRQLAGLAGASRR
jgi:zinc transport system substrate-binding protein